jgi:VRR-NUC domain
MTVTSITPPQKMSEAELLECVLQTAALFGWRSAHFRPAMTKHGWRTAVSGDGKGWPDLVLVRDRLLFVELKSARGSLSADQKAWRDSLVVAAGCEWHLWRPSDWTDGTIESVLRKVA